MAMMSDGGTKGNGDGNGNGDGDEKNTL